MASYNVDRDFDKMRQEAIERIRSMQRRSRQVITPGNISVDEKSEKVNDNKKNAEEPVHTSQLHNQNNIQDQRQKGRSSNGQANPINNILNSLFPNTGGQNKKGILSEIFDGFNISEENALIGILIYVLAKNGADVKLLLGLGYLLL